MKQKRIVSSNLFGCIRHFYTMLKNNLTATSSKKGKSLAKPNPASVDLFSEDRDSVPEVEDEFDDSGKDGHFVPLPESTDDDDDSGDDDETDINKSPLVKSVTKSVKAAMLQVPELHPADRKPNEGAIWNYFSKRIERDEGDALIKKEAVCKVINHAVGRGVPCGATLQQPGCSTTGPRNHLKRKHPKQWAELLAIEHAKVQVKRGAKRVLHQTFDSLEGENQNSYIENKTSKYSIEIINGET